LQFLQRGIYWRKYVNIIYIAFFVFIGIIFIISTSFLPVMAEAGGDVASSGMSAEGFLGAFDIDVFKRIFLHASLLQGFCSGLVAGKMGSGHIAAGLKHSVAMMLVSYGVFTILI